MATEKLVQLDPKAILADDNSRYSLKPFKVEALAQAIIAAGGVQVPIIVEPIADAGKGITHRLTAGFYRHAAVKLLNAENAGLLLPAIVRPSGDALARLKAQLSENMDRENQSPMDKAIAIQKLMDAGMARADIRKMFSVPGGRKGMHMQPVSNAWLNLTLSFLELPKAIQEKIHDGRLPLTAAYELLKVSPEKRQVVLDKAESERLDAIDADEKAEAKLEAVEAKAAEATGKLTAVQEELAAADKAKADALAALEEKRAAVKAITSVPGFLELPAEEKKLIGEKLAGAKMELREAEKANSKAVKDQDKAMHKAKAVEEAINGKKKAKAEAASEAKANPTKVKGKVVSQRDVKKAAGKVEGATATGPVALNAAEMRDACKHVTSSGMTRAKAIGNLFLDCFAGKMTAGALRTQVEVATGERKVKKG